MLPDPSMETCQKHLEPHHAAFWRAITGAFKRFRGLSAEDQAIFSKTKRAKANVIRRGRQILWSYQINQPADAVGVIPISVPPAGPARVVAKRKPKKASGESAGGDAR